MTFGKLSDPSSFRESLERMEALITTSLYCNACGEEFDVHHENGEKLTAEQRKCPACESDNTQVVPE